MKMKKLFALILALILTLTLFGCGANTRSVVGTWQRETMYLSHYGCDADMFTTFSEDGTYISVLREHGTDDVLNTDVGTWELEDGEVVSQSSKPGSGKVYYTFNPITNTLDNGGNEYKKIG